jgi:hypothetical protein
LVNYTAENDRRESFVLLHLPYLLAFARKWRSRQREKEGGEGRGNGLLIALLEYLARAVFVISSFAWATFGGKKKK